MESPPRKKKDWVLTEQSLARFLSTLNEDREQAGEQYELIRRKLLKFFEWRGSTISHELADETLNRLVRKVDEGEAIRNLPAYFSAMARLVWLEALKEQERAQGAFNELRASGQHPSQTDSRRLECVDACLEALPLESRGLIVDYYRAEKSIKIQLRKRLAKKLGTPLNALRIRAHRIRLQLEKCVVECLKESE